MEEPSGNGLDAAQAEAAKQPVWHAAAANGRPAVRFDGNDDALRTSYFRDLLFTSYQATVFAVFRTTGPAGPRGLLSVDWVSLGTTPEKGGSLAYSMGGTTGTGTMEWKTVGAARQGGVLPDRWTLGAVVRGGPGAGQTRLFVNGVENGDGTAVPYHMTNTDHASIGCLRNESGFWSGDLAEMLVYGEGLPDAQRKAVERYLMQKYRLAAARSQKRVRRKSRVVRGGGVRVEPRT